jgi:uroporphyrin-III C-methyltransferase
VGIPVTHRGTSNGFFVLTGTLSDGTLNPEILLAAKTNATVVILMGLSKLGAITNIYNEVGKSNQAFSVISNGSLPNQKSVIGTTKTISQNVSDKAIKSPALIVIGDVVSLSSNALSDLTSYNLN